MISSNNSLRPHKQKSSFKKHDRRRGERFVNLAPSLKPSGNRGVVGETCGLHWL